METKIMLGNKNHATNLSSTSGSKVGGATEGKLPKVAPNPEQKKSVVISKFNGDKKEASAVPKTTKNNENNNSKKSNSKEKEKDKSNILVTQSGTSLSKRELKKSIVIGKESSTGLNKQVKSPEKSSTAQNKLNSINNSLVSKKLSSYNNFVKSTDKKLIIGSSSTNIFESPDKRGKSTKAKKETPGNQYILNSIPTNNNKFKYTGDALVNSSNVSTVKKKPLSPKKPKNPVVLPKLNKSTRVLPTKKKIKRGFKYSTKSRSGSAKSNRSSVTTCSTRATKIGALLYEEGFEYQSEEMRNYLKKSSPLRISQPYMDHYTFNRVFNPVYKEKQKWITKKGFDNKIGAFHPNYIENYVVQSQGTKAQDVKFRDVKKEKWLYKEGFNYKNGDDYLIKYDEDS